MLPPSVHVMALTATATLSSHRTICHTLVMSKPVLVAQSPNKPNISTASFRRSTALKEVFGPWWKSCAEGERQWTGSSFSDRHMKPVQTCTSYTGHGLVGNVGAKCPNCVLTFPVDVFHVEVARYVLSGFPMCVDRVPPQKLMLELAGTRTVKAV